VAIVFLVTTTLLGWKLWPSSNPCDYFQFWLVGKAVSELPVDDVYSSRDRTRMSQYIAGTTTSDRVHAALNTRSALELAGTPFLYSVFSVLSTGRFESDYRFFTLLSWLALFGGISWLAFALRFPPWLFSVYVFLLLVFFQPLHRELAVANVNRLQVGALVFVILLLSRESQRAHFLGAMLLGLLVVFKPNTMFVAAFLALASIAYLARRRAGLLLGGLALGVGVALALPALLFGARCSWSQWIASAPSMMLIDPYLRGGFFALLAGTTDVTLLSLWGVVSGGVATAAFAYAIRGTARPGSRAPAERLQLEDLCLVIALGTSTYLLSSSIVHTNYFVLTIPTMIFLLRPKGRMLAMERWIIVSTLLSGFLIGAHPLFDRLLLTRHLDYPFHSLWTFAGVWIQVGNCLLELRSRRRHSPSSAGEGSGRLRGPAAVESV
jgi:hypothetical protein